MSRRSGRVPFISLPDSHLPPPSQADRGPGCSCTDPTLGIVGAPVYAPYWPYRVTRCSCTDPILGIMGAPVYAPSRPYRVTRCSCTDPILGIMGAPVYAPSWPYRGTGCSCRHHSPRAIEVLGAPSPVHIPYHCLKEVLDTQCTTPTKVLGAPVLPLSWAYKLLGALALAISRPIEIFGPPPLAVGLS